MTHQPQLNEREWRFVLHLLEAERGDLQSEIRRTREPHMRDDLQAKLRMIEDLLQRLRTALPSETTSSPA